MRRTSLGLGLLGLGLLLLLPGLARAEDEAREAPVVALDPAAALEKARVDGKYRMLLHQIEVAEDATAYGEFRDYGPWQGTAYKSFQGLEPGHWVYVRPYWYVWRDLASEIGEKRAWGPEQATGAPDTPEQGDYETAWASESEDDQDEWLLLEYEAPLRPIAIIVFETYNPGALEKVSVFDLQGNEIVVWEGADPAATAGGIAVLPLHLDVHVTRVKLHLASKRVEGWNEIDAVGVLDESGNAHWATSAHASSTYADPPLRLEITPQMPPLEITFDEPILIPTPFPLPPADTPWPTVTLPQPVLFDPAPRADAEPLRQMQEALDRIQEELDALRARLAELIARGG
ncbi:MAG: hypothetical protein ACYTG6_00210 [Planctomycetota bacterium]|jgi:hypothetical protein